MRLTPRFGILTLLIVVACASLLAWLNTQETTTITEPYYAPLMGAVRHPPPYTAKEMAVSVYIDRGWPIWHTREIMGVMAHNAGLYIEDYGTPNARLRVGGGFDLRDPAFPETSCVRLAINAGIGLMILIAVALASEFFIRVCGSWRRPTKCGRIVPAAPESPSLFDQREAAS